MLLYVPEAQLRLRLALSPAWPRGMPPGRSADVTAMLCTSPPTPPLHFLCLWSPLVARERRMRGSMPRFLPVGPSSLPPPSPPLPPSAVCVPQLRPGEQKLQVQGLGAGEGGSGRGGGMKQAMTFPFPAWLSQSNKTFKSHECCFRFPFPTPPKPQAVKLNALFDEFHFEFHIKVLPI